MLAVLVIAWLDKGAESPPQRPLVVPAVPVPQADSAECEALMAALPQKLGDDERAQIQSPVPPGTAAWRKGPDDQPILLRCGVGQPADFAVGAALREIGGVQWFAVEEQNTGRSTWFAVDRPVYLALTLAKGMGATPVQQISEVVGAKMPAVPIRPGPPR